MTSILIACLAKKIKYVYFYFMKLMHECEGGVCILMAEKPTILNNTYILPQYHRCVHVHPLQYSHLTFIVYFHKGLDGSCSE
jgi:hypothetical protein